MYESVPRRGTNLINVVNYQTSDQKIRSSIWKSVEKWKASGEVLLHKFTGLKLY